MQKSKKLIFFGTEDFSLTSLQALLEAGFNVVAIVTKPDSRSGRGQKLTTPKIKEAAISHGIKVLQPVKVAEAKDQISALAPSIGVLVSYGKIIPSSIIDLFPHGIVNLHPSLLPAWRGPSPIESVILAGDKLTGVSLMRLTAGMDEGPVYSTAKVELGGTETSAELHERLSRVGADLLVKSLPAVLADTLKPKPQEESKASYSKLLKKEDGLLDFGQAADLLERKVRAFQNFPKARAKINSHEVIITKSRVAGSKNDGALVIKCQPGWLEILQLIGPSGKTMSGADFLRGYQKN